MENIPQKLPLYYPFLFMSPFHNFSQIQFGSAISYFRKARNITVNELSLLIGQTSTEVLDIENNRIMPSEKLVAEIADVLNIPYEIFELEATLRTPSENSKVDSTRKRLIPIFGFLTQKLIIE